ncbi:MAG: SufD family Fe-S cluster assembly protein [Acidobacteria bacterium]|nr:SufD family Fe-S cluster assembly protein [Acidobacteriota bacterium]
MNMFKNNQIEILKEEFSKKSGKFLIYDSSLIKPSDDYESMKRSSFEEIHTSPEGFCNIEEMAEVAYDLSDVAQYEKEFIEPTTGFGYFALSRFEKAMTVLCKESKKTGYIKIKSGESLTLEPIFIDVPENAESSLLLHFDLSAGGIAFDFIRARVGKRGNLTLYLLYENFKGKRFVDFSSHLGMESSLKVFPVFLEGESTLFRSNHTMKEEKSSYIEKLIVLLKNKGKGDFRTVISEENEEVKVNVAGRGVLKDSTRALINGLLKVKKEAIKSSSLYSAHLLKLSQDSKADIQPNLEIEALDVTASHSASVAPVDEEKLFYLESRGLDKESAKKEVSNGFLCSLIENSSFIQEKIEEIL